MTELERPARKAFREALMRLDGRQTIEPSEARALTAALNALAEGDYLAVFAALAAFHGEKSAPPLPPTVGALPTIAEIRQRFDALKRKSG